MGWKLLLSVMLVLALFAGCAAKKDPVATEVTPTLTTPTVLPADPNLKAVLDADLKGGATPLPVTFDLGLNGPGNSTHWELSFGDGNSTTGKSVPASVTYNYTVAGVFLANLTVTLDNGLNLADHVEINVTQGVKASVGPLGSVPFAASGTVVVGSQGLTCGNLGEGVDVISFTWSFPADVLGTPAAVQGLWLNMTLGPTNLDSDLFLYDPTGAEVAHSSDINVPLLGAAGEAIAYDKPLVAGDYTITVVGCVGVEADFDLEGNAILVAAA